MRRLRLFLWVVVGLAAVAALGVYAFRSPPAPAPTTSGAGVADLGGPFTLTGSDGQPFSSSRLAGRPFVIFFGFTHCPDVCPTTLARMARLRKALGKGDEAFAIVFVSVDPERDKPADMARYGGLFGTPVIGLTGSPAAIDRVKQEYGIYSKKVAQPGGDYSVDHTATVLLFDRAGRFTATIATDEGDAPALDKLKALTS
ncbi:MAG: SCO family protein [Sphingomicrobium sp.]